MFCTKCGHQCEETDRFCTECGTTLILEQPPIEPTSETDPIAPPATDPVPAPVATPTPSKKGRLRVPIIIMCLLTVIGLSAFFVFRAHTDPAQPWLTARNGMLTFDEALFTGGSLTVPSTIDGQPVTKINTACFIGSTTVTEVTVTEGVEKVGALAFAYATDLRAVSLSDSVTSVGMLAFMGCPNLEVVRIGPSVEYLDSTAFMGCTKLKYIFFHGTAQQWEAMYDGTAPEGVTVYLADSTGFEAYIPN